MQLFAVPGDKKLTVDTISHIALMAEQRLKRMPVQYVVGEWDFHDVNLKLVPPVFIPRPETEVCFLLFVHSYAAYMFVYFMRFVRFVVPKCISQLVFSSL